MLEPFSYDVPVVQLRLDRGDLGRRRQGAREDQRPSAEPRRRRTTRSRRPIRRRRRRPAVAAAAAAQNQTGKRELAWRTDGQGLTYVEQEPAPAARTRCGGGRPPTPRDTGDQPPTRRPDAAAAPARARPRQRKDRLYQWLRAVRRRRARRSSTRTHADLRPPLSRPTCRSCSSASAPARTRSSTAVYLDRHRRRSTRSRATVRMTSTPTPVRSSRRAAAAVAAARGGAAAAVAARAAAARRCCCRPTASSVFFQGTTLRQEPERRSRRRPSSTRSRSRPARRSASTRARTPTSFERVSTIIDADAKQFIIARESPTEVPQSSSLDGGAQRVQLTKNADPHPGPDQGARSSASPSSVPTGSSSASR